jgi:hypothetical protein
VKTTFAIVLCFIFSITSGIDLFALRDKYTKREVTCSHISGDNLINLLQAGSRGSHNSTPACKGNGIVIFVNTSSQPLWFYYWYPQDVADASHECRFRRLWKQLDAGNNLFAIPKDKTLIFRICTGTQCADSFIKQYGIVQYCNVNNGIILVK